jgi:hypothetical protein
LLPLHYPVSLLWATRSFVMYTTPKEVRLQWCLPSWNLCGNDFQKHINRVMPDKSYNPYFFYMFC